MVSKKTKKKILDEYYNEGLTLLEIIEKHHLTGDELKEIILESQD